MNPPLLKVLVAGRLIAYFFLAMKSIEIDYTVTLNY